MTAADGATSELEAPHIILATGARARTLPGIEPDGERIWTYREAMVPTALPSSLLVVGSGAIGIEFASFYGDLGVDVTVVELLPQILPAEDAEIAKFARRQFERQGMQIHTDAQVTRVSREGEGLVADVKLADGTIKTLTPDRLILAVGITGNVDINRFMALK